MENSGRSYRQKHGNRERGADTQDSWRNQDHNRGQAFRSDGGQQRNQCGLFQVSPRRGGLGPFSAGGFRGGHSPSQRDNHWFSNQETSQGDHWREGPQLQQPSWRKGNLGEGQNEEREQWRRGGHEDCDHKSGKGWRNQNKRSSYFEEACSHVGEEPTLSPMELQRILLAEKELKKDEIFYLKKRSHKNPNALFTCMLCDILLDNVPDARAHTRNRRHRRRAKEKKELKMLTEIQPPDQEHIIALNDALERVVQNHGMTDQDVENRCCVVSVMQDLLMSVLPEIRLRLYGSSCTKFGFKDSDVNIDIQFPPHMHQPDVLLLVKESLALSPLFVDVEDDFHARVPVIICRERQSGLVCKVSAGNENAFQTTAYLSALASREPLLHPLVLGFRHWARICQIDRSDEGGLPPYVFALMVIFFLQQRKKPILPSYLNKEMKIFSLGKLQDFSLTHVEDGHMHWTYTPTESSQTLEATSAKGKVPLVFPKALPSVEVGLLWTEMLRFYSLEFIIADNVISVRTGAILTREIKDWPKTRIAVEDPFAVKRNVARTLNSQQMYDYVLHCLKTSYKYFALPLNSSAVSNKSDSQQQLSLKADSTEVISATENGPEDSDCIIEEEVEEDSDCDGEMGTDNHMMLSEDEIDKVLETCTREHLDSVNTEEEIFPVDELSRLSDKEGAEADTHGSVDEDEEEEELVPVSVSPSSVVDADKNEVTAKEPAQRSFEFTLHALTRGKPRMVVCSICKRDGHLRKDCPDDFKKVQLEPLPAMTPSFLSTIDSVCEQCFMDFAPDELELGVREHIIQDLEKFVRRQFSGARLKLFGSSKNGFGFRQSDLDICMVLEGQETMEDVDCINIIKNLAKLLRRHPDLKNILPITTAKVPIVKFLHMDTGLEGDISLYNTLALHNTNLLALYAAIDQRVKILCYVMKVFAKMCDIRDASRGSLSSYAYTLMVLYFLQQRNPPVIPVLQEIHDGKKPEVLVDGWNVYFFDDLKSLPSRWPSFGQNRETVGELWLGLLRFYTEDFNFREHVICIRQHACLTTFHKQWTSKCIVIEDPFDLNHNLGAGLSRKMTNFIMKAFINARSVFGAPIEVFPQEYPTHMEYFFDPDLLTEGEVVPNDRCCRVCGKIGHFIKDCPLRKKSKQRRDSENSENPWRMRDTLEKRCCFLCGSTAHIKRDCELYRGPAGNLKLDGFPSTSSAPMRIIRPRGSPSQEDKNRRQQQNVKLGPQAGSLACRNLERPVHRKSPAE
ncbi:terminal uridylyltransferase 7 [Synchiropus splendidus]|uniref:terminal uridylyltransferase 7 n=1 Tax=Synchiropus splendidus TaxID=270530 RepID=UPI00237E8EA1|nr:terminal uridylyltransferase 7 [Synchiropus splendidus]